MTNCPNCGAPINPHKEKCEYCDTYYEKPTAPPPIKCKKSDSISAAAEYVEILQMALSEEARQSKKPAKKEMPPENDYDAPLWAYFVAAGVGIAGAIASILLMQSVF